MDFQHHIAAYSQEIGQWTPSVAYGSVNAQQPHRGPECPDANIDVEMLPQFSSVHMFPSCTAP